MTGDILIAAGALAYLGAFTNEYREELIESWLSHCKNYDIDTTENYSLIAILVDPYEIRQWNTYGLPRDKVSIENGIFVTQSTRWPLMIDPQEQVIIFIAYEIYSNLIFDIICKYILFLRQIGGYEIWNKTIT